MLEDKLKQHENYVIRKNIYVFAVTGAGGYYIHNGYTCIDVFPTDDYYNNNSDADSEDEAIQFIIYGSCSGMWFSKPLKEKLIGEREYIPIFSRIIEDKQRNHYSHYFNNVNDDLITNLEKDVLNIDTFNELIKNLKVYKDNCGNDIMETLSSKVNN